MLMDATKLFRSHVIKWLCDNDCPNLDLFFDDQFGYVINHNTGERAVGIGIFTSTVMIDWYKQFLYEYGAVEVKDLDIVLPFLHEVGHFFTLDNFNDLELAIFMLNKSLDDDDISQGSQEEYWLMPDEMAANVWAINFIRNHMVAIKELQDIFYTYWDEMVEEICNEWES